MILSLEAALADSAVVAEIAKATGATVDQVRAVAAALGELPFEQTVRICGTAAGQKFTAKQRQARRKR